MIAGASPSPDDLLTDAEVGELLGNKGTALKRWRRLGVGPAYVRLTKGRGVRYRREDVAAWLETRRHDPRGRSLPNRTREGAKFGNNGQANECPRGSKAANNLRSVGQVEASLTPEPCGPIRT